MSSANCEDCVFRQFEKNPLAMPSGFGAFMEDNPETPSATAEMIAAMEAPLCCNVKGCNLSMSALMRYVIGAGNRTPREELDEMVASSCILLDVPHAVEEFRTYPDDPRA